MRNDTIKANELQGAYTQIVIPKKDGEVDFNKLEMLIEDQLVAGIDGIVVDAAQIPQEDPVGILDRIFQYVNRRARFIVSIGPVKTEEAIALSKATIDKIGSTTFLHETNHYQNRAQERLLGYYTSIAQGTPRANIIIYNSSTDPDSSLKPKTVISLAANPMIIGIEIATPDTELVKEIRDGTDRKSFIVLSGDDHYVPEMIASGADGIISKTANIAPRYFAEMTHTALDKGHYWYDKVSGMQRGICPLVNAIFSTKPLISLAYLFGNINLKPLRDGENIQARIDRALQRHTPAQLGLDINKYRKVD